RALLADKIPHQLFACSTRVTVGGIEKIPARLEVTIENIACRLLVRAEAPVGSKCHRAEAERTHSESRTPERDVIFRFIDSSSSAFRCEQARNRPHCGSCNTKRMFRPDGGLGSDAFQGAAPRGPASLVRQQAYSEGPLGQTGASSNSCLSVRPSVCRRRPYQRIRVPDAV